MLNTQILFFFFFYIVIACASSAHSSSTRPNILFILTDDLDSELGGLTPLNKTRAWIGDRGAYFPNAFVTTPICCPSRSSILTGCYQHNTQVWNNSVSGNCGSETKWQRGPETRTFATALKEEAGYLTFYAGKYLNQYGKKSTGGVKHVPPGWDFWAGLVGNSRYYDYTLSVNGKPERHGSSYERDYLTDVISRKAHSFLDLLFHRQLDHPFLMVLSPPSPHAPFTPAPQYAKHFQDRKAPRTPSFNFVPEDSKQDKHWLVRSGPRPLSEDMVEEVDEAFRNRWRTLLSVDDLVSGVLERLNSSGLLDNTYVIFTSDHGYHLGQFGLPLDKRQLYETDIRIPLMLRGPNIAPKTVEKSMVLSIDLAPTILDMAGLGVGKYDHMDGKSFLPLVDKKHEANPGPENKAAKVDNVPIVPFDLHENGINKPAAGERKLNYFNASTPVAQHSFLVEYYGEHGGRGIEPGCQDKTDSNEVECQLDFGCKCQDARNNTYSCVRTLSDSENTVFCTFQDKDNFHEMYNLHTDPFQLHNLAAGVNHVSKAFYLKAIEDLKVCSGHKNCWK